MKRRLALQTLAIAGASASALGLLAACGKKGDAPFRAVDITGAEYARDFQLTDHNGQTRRLKDFAGRVVVLFFGFTQCPDVCPTTMVELVEVRKLLGADGQKVQGLFVTLDPERDTADVLKAYMANFDPSFLALRGSPEQTAAIAKDFKVFYKKVDGKTPSSYTLEHSAASFVYDTRGQLRLYARYGGGAQALADDLRLLLAQA